MTRATIAEHRKHIYFYTLLVLGTVLLAMLKPLMTAKPQGHGRAAEVNKLSNTLFQ